jgi:hypothetical protein
MVTEVSLETMQNDDHVLERGDWVQWRDWPDNRVSHIGIVISDGVCNCGKMFNMPHVRVMLRGEDGQPHIFFRTPNRLRWIGRREDPSPDRSASPGSCHRA